jgi:hypothetical protein
MRKLLRRTLLIGICGCGLLLAPGSASAAMTLGETFTPTVDFGGSGIFIQTASPGDVYTVPSDGVITSWSFEAASSAGSPLKLKMLRRVNDTDFTTVGDSQLETPALGTLNTWPTRIAVKAGDVPAEFYSDDSLNTLSYRDVPGYVTQELDTGLDPPPGTTATYEPANGSSHQIDLSTVLEPDADHDSFGDETQDQCPGTAGPLNGCPAPKPHKKCKKKKKHKSGAVIAKKCKKKHHH